MKLKKMMIDYLKSNLSLLQPLPTETFFELGIDDIERFDMLDYLDGKLSNLNYKGNITDTFTDFDDTNTIEEVVTLIFNFIN